MMNLFPSYNVFNTNFPMNPFFTQLQVLSLNMNTQDKLNKSNNFKRNQPNVSGDKAKQQKENIENTPVDDPSLDNSKKPTIINETKFKTELCKNWMETGTCNYGKKCKFAHGFHELNSKTIPNKGFKTKFCNQFHNNQYCPYGQRCLFIHKYKACDDIQEYTYQKKLNLCSSLQNGCWMITDQNRLSSLEKLSQIDSKSIVNN